jgi:hypothetical protein
MSSALKKKAWVGVGVSTDEVREVFSLRDCVSCSVGKINRLPRNDGSGIRPLGLVS